VSISEMWKPARLDAISRLVGGGTPSRNISRNFGGDILWATPSDLTSQERFFLETTEETITNDGLRDSSAHLLPVGTVLMTSRATIGVTAITTKPTTTNQGFANFICEEQLVNNKFLALYLREAKPKLLRLASGSTFLEVSRSTLSKLEIPLPPLLEQERIVSILEQAEKIRILQADTLERIDELLDNYFQEICYQNKAQLTTLGDLHLIVTKGSTPPESEIRSERTNSVPLIKVNNISTNGRLIFSDENNFVSKKCSDNLLNRSIGKPYDVVLNIVGPPMGKIGFLTNEYPEYNMNQAVALIRKNQKIEPLFLFFALRSKNTFKQIMAFSVTARQVNLSLQKLKEIQIPIVESKKQKEFVEIVNHLYEIREKILAQRELSTQTLSRVTKSAFAGTLTQKWREQPDIAPQLEQQAKARDALLAGQTTEIPEDDISESLPPDNLSNTSLRATFASHAFEQLRDNQKMKLQATEDIKPAQYMDTFLRIVDLELQPHTEKAMLETPSQLMGFLQESEDTTLQEIASTLSSMDFTTRAEFNPKNPRHPRAYFWQEVTENSPLRMVYNAFRIAQGYSNLQTITKTLEDLNEPLEEHRIARAIDTLESAGLIEAVVLEMPSQSNLSTTQLIPAYRLPNLESPKFVLPPEHP
jgi:type I restriction enzyme, S subunit